MGGYSNECGKFFNNPSTYGSVSAQPTCTEEEIKAHQKQTIERLKTLIENSEGSEKVKLQKALKNQQNRLLSLKQENRPFYKKHSDTIRTIVIIGVAYYIWKSGLLTKILN